MRAFVLPSESPEFDYGVLMDRLKGYRRPRDKVSELLRRGEIVRIKKGIYVLGARHGRDVSLPVLANMIYGPSYVSRQYALAHHQLVPERVYEITSMTPTRDKEFSTPLGVFSYQRAPSGLYAVGVTRVALDERRGFLMATPEKAIADLIYRERVESLEALEELLTEGLRIEPGDLKALRLGLLSRIERCYQSRPLELLTGLVRRMK